MLQPLGNESKLVWVVNWASEFRSRTGSHNPYGEPAKVMRRKGEGRWDYRVTIVFKSVAAAHTPEVTEEELKKIIPDQATFKKEKQRRFELLEAHWDLPLVTVGLPLTQRCAWG